MRLVALDIPDDPAEFPGWLERHLVGLDLAALVAELEAVHGPDGEGGGLDDVLGDRREAVMERGLSALPREAIRRLLRRPRLLLDLQERALVDGGEHWQRLVGASGDLDASIEAGRGRLAGITGAGEPGEEAEDRSAVLPMSRPVAWDRRPWVVSLATAASVLVAVAVYDRAREPGPVAAAGWGWSRPGALEEDGPPSTYLERLADAAQDWFKKRPDGAPALARRIGEFRQGCSTLILATHKPLSDKDRAWLVGKCRDWAAKLDGHLRAVEAGDDPARVLGEADETVRKLIAALRNRATEV